MTIARVRPNNHLKLREIASRLRSARKALIVTGAGISTNARIPDFRSGKGIYSTKCTNKRAAEDLGRPLKRQKTCTLSGRRLFHSSALLDPETKPVFYQQITKFRQDHSNAEPTDTHKFIRDLCDAGKLVRDYTMNIDRLEEKTGLSTDLLKGGSNASFFMDLSVICVVSPAPGLAAGTRPGEKQLPYQDKVPLVHIVPEYQQPDIVLYDENDLRYDTIHTIIQHDLSLRPDILLVFGTSLTTARVKCLVKDFAKVVHSQGGQVVLVNLTEPAESEWNGVIDYWVEWDCDAWVRDLKMRVPVFGGDNRSIIAQKAGSTRRPIDLTGNDLARMGVLYRGRGRPGESRNNPVDLTSC
ncbi:DHS-like NAD/FAD-binding domain-containing protein [Zalerion maritima]|uniref:DHS-like NAD/FAD-binding domain-containing protein n=1 Tax=Zalerion maritima TaxID=339359 RepID=A0AAD5RH75_9PEZI|nr:DHS-like NAD/FAD-binding domain-containing protein [Zalerion maritima]